jgi:hypothetical protein
MRGSVRHRYVVRKEPAEMDENTRGPAFGIRIAAELAVIFIGVTAAFFVENYREQAQMENRADQLAAGLHADVTGFRFRVGLYIDEIRGGIAEFRAAQTAGGRPVPFVLRVPGAEGAPVQVWEAAMQSGAGEVLDPDVVLELANLYHEIDGETPKYERYAVFTEQEIWPLIAGDTAAFYDPRGRLLPRFEAHLRQLDEIVMDLDRLLDLADAAARLLEERYPDVAKATPVK